MRADDRVVLIDVENTVGSVRPRPELVRRRVAALVAAAGPAHHVVACYATDDPAADPVVSVLAELGVAPWPVLPATNAADHALVRHARYVHGRGGRVFAVASGDRQFAQLAVLGRLEVLVWETQKIARVLERAAHEVVRVPAPSGATATAPGNGDGEAPRLPVVAGGRSGTGAPAGQVAPTYRGPSPAGGPSPLWRGAVRAVLAGVGVGIGQHLSRAVLGR